MDREIQISGKEIEGKIELSYNDGFIGARLILKRAPNTIVYRCYLQNADHDTIYLGICEPTDDGLGLSVNVRGDEQFDQCLITIGRMDEAYQVAAFGEYEETEAEVAQIENTDMEKSDTFEEISEETEIAQETDTGENSIAELEETKELEHNEEGDSTEDADTDGEAFEMETITAADDGTASEEEIAEEQTIQFEEEAEETTKQTIGFHVPQETKCAAIEETVETEETGVLDRQDECIQSGLDRDTHTAGEDRKETFDYLGLCFVKCDNIMNEQMCQLEKQIFMYDGINYAFQKYGFVLRAYEENAVIYAIPSNIYKDPHPILHLALYTSYHNIRAFGCDGYFIIGVDKQKNCYFTVIDE